MRSWILSRTSNKHSRQGIIDREEVLTRAIMVQEETGAVGEGQDEVVGGEEGPRGAMSRDSI